MSEFEQKVLSKLDEINQKLDKVLQASGSPAVAAPAAPTPAPAPAATTVSPSALVEKQRAEDEQTTAPPVEGRRTCPSCGGFDFNAVEDKSQLLSAMGGIKIYAKNYVCKKCGYTMPK